MSFSGRIIIVFDRYFSLSDLYTHRIWLWRIKLFVQPPKNAPCLSKTTFDKTLLYFKQLDQLNIIIQLSVADDSGVWECLELEHNSMHQLNIAGIAVGAAHNMASRLTFIPEN